MSERPKHEGLEWLTPQKSHNRITRLLAENAALRERQERLESEIAYIKDLLKRATVGYLSVCSTLRAKDLMQEVDAVVFPPAALQEPTT